MFTRRELVCSNDGRVYGLDLASDKKVWEYEAASPVKSSPAVATGKGRRRHGPTAGPYVANASILGGIRGMGGRRGHHPVDDYRMYGDTRVLEEQYPSMARWVEYMRERAGDAG